MRETKQRFDIDFFAGMTIDSAYTRLKEVEACWHGKVKVYGSFNEKELNSDMTLDECYIAITGLTKEAFDKKQAEEHEKRLKHKKEHMKRVPELCAEYLDLAKNTGLVDSEKLDVFERCLPAQVSSIYEGYQIKSMFEINKILIEYKDTPEKAIELAIECFNNQGHSGFSASIVASLVKEYSPVLGSLFYKKAYEPWGIY